MRFRTEIEPHRMPFGISYNTPVVLLGSCFTDEIGQRLEHDGFTVCRNPLGPLYNPVSIHNCIEQAYSALPCIIQNLVEGPRGYHCLDYASRYSGPEARDVAASVDRDLAVLREALLQRPVVIITLGSAFVYRYLPTDVIVGNCHKLPDTDFRREMLECDEITSTLISTIRILFEMDVRGIIFTVSPIRHLADGLHGNVLSKSALQIALDKALELSDAARCCYFPSYEIILDDLRDYRFYAADMKHPSEVAVDYIYENFGRAFFDKATFAAAEAGRARYLRTQHKPLL